MTGSTLTAILLAGGSLLGSGNLGAASRRTGRANGAEALIWLLLVVGIIAVVCVAIRFVSRLQRRRSRYSHGALFQGLCRAHGLDRGARRLLKQIARHHRLSQPARLFTEPKWLAPANLGGSLHRRLPQVTALRTRLFA